MKNCVHCGATFDEYEIDSSGDRICPTCGWSATASRVRSKRMKKSRPWFLSVLIWVAWIFGIILVAGVAKAYTPALIDLVASTIRPTPRSAPARLTSFFLNEGSFTINSPVVLTKTVTTVGSPVGQLREVVYSGGDDAVYYGVMYMDFPPSRLPTSPATALEAAVQYIVSSQHAKIVVDHNAVVSGFPGKDAQLFLQREDSGTVTILMKLALNKGRLYEAVVVADGTTPSRKAREFVDSLVLLRAQHKQGGLSASRR